ncbi:hypothetical protein V7654_21835 [Bacillus sp. JJ1609]|uniref:hypothetical protein n=1 Tax=Bacillus sp. JJ1609 TaxID=3122977 RepID=UPI002FFF4601
MKANEKRWFWILIIILAILTPIMNHFFNTVYFDFISFLIVIIALNSTKELRIDLKNIGTDTGFSILFV